MPRTANGLRGEKRKELALEGAEQTLKQLRTEAGRLQANEAVLGSTAGAEIK